MSPATWRSIAAIVWASRSICTSKLAACEALVSNSTVRLSIGSGWSCGTGEIRATTISSRRSPSSRGPEKCSVRSRPGVMSV
jgi:hypothetical protein